MMSPSRTPHNGGNVWKRLLITAFILSWRIQSTPTQNDSVSVVPNPPNGTVGSSITLDIWGFSGEAFSYNWYRKTTDSSNRFITYHIPSGVQTPADKRETVFPNGSLLIPNLTLNDTDLYIVQIIDSRGVITVIARGQLTVNAEKSTENGNGSSFSEGVILLLKTGILAGVALMGGLICFMFFRKTERGFGDFADLTSSLIFIQVPVNILLKTIIQHHRTTTKEVSYIFMNFSAQKPHAQAHSQHSPTDCIYYEIKEK